MRGQGRDCAQRLYRRTREVPLGRIGRAEKFANIASPSPPARASYITGTAINVDGRRSPVV
jgi:3-oxoacyl-[acyl-carrier protein] reductase